MSACGTWDYRWLALRGGSFQGILARIYASFGENHQCYRKKLRTIVLKFETFVCSRNCKIICIFCMHGGNTLPIGRINSPPQGGKFFTVGIIRKNISKYAKLMVEPYICDSVSQIYRFLFSFLTKCLKLLKNV